MRTLLAGAIASLVLCIITYQLGVKSGYAHGWVMGSEAQSTTDTEMQVKAGETPCKQSHHYEFKTNGASIYRFDLDTGESCMIQSNEIDKWSLGKCPAPTN
jgi:hypothetical protein